MNDQSPNAANDGTLLGFTSSTNITGFDYSRSLGRRNAFGIKGQSTTEGIVSIEAFTTGALTFEHNGIAACSLSSYDSATYDNLCPSYATWEAQFVDYSGDGDGGDYLLVCESDDTACTPNIYRAAWNEDIGADIDLVLEHVNGCESCGAQQAPYSGTAFAVPGTFEAEHFDVGGEGLAYHDNVPGNSGGAFRTSDDVDILAATGSATGFVVNNFETGEWLEYTIDVANAAGHTIELHVSSQYTASRFHVEIDGVDATGSVAVPNTGGWSAFEWVMFGGVNLSAGQHVVRIYAEEQYFNVDAVRIRAQAPYGGTAAAVPGTFQAENFDTGGESVAYHDAVAGNAGGVYRTSEDVDLLLPTGNNTGQVVHNFQSGEWIEYTVNVTTAGTYAIQLKLSSTYTTSHFHVEVDGVDVSGSVLVASTGSWNTFQLVAGGSATFTAGQHVVRIVADQEYFNLDATQIQ